MSLFLRWTSVVLFVLLSLFLMAFGVLYATVDHMLWFHAAAVPDTAQESVQPLYFALMNLVGGASGALGVLGAYVSLGPVRRGELAAAAAVSAAYIGAFLMAAVTAEELAQATGSPTSWHIMGLLIGTAFVALAAQAGARSIPPEVAAQAAG